MPVPIVVEIVPHDSPVELRQALLDACTRAAEDAECTEHAPDAGAVTRAKVTWNAALAQLEVVLEREPGGEPTVLGRTLSFGAGDAPEQRWRAVGLVVGTLASVSRAAEPEGPVAAPEPEPIPPVIAPPTVAPPLTEANAPPPAGPPPRAPGRDVAGPSQRAEAGAHRGVVGVSAIIGTAFDRGVPRAGVELDGRILVARGLHATAAASYAESVQPIDGMRGTWIEARIGAGAYAEISEGVTAGGAVEAIGQRLTASVDEDTPNGPTSAGRFVGGARAGGRIEVWLGESFGVATTAAVEWMFGTTTVRSESRTVATAGAFDGIGSFGAVYRFR